MVFNSRAVLFTMINDGDSLRPPRSAFAETSLAHSFAWRPNKPRMQPYSRRLLALAEIYDAGSRSDAARNGGVGLQTIRDWVRRSNTWGPDGLKDCKASGLPSRLKDEHRRALIQMVEQGPNPAMHGVVRWRLTNVAQCA